MEDFNIIHLEDVTRNNLQNLTVSIPKYRWVAVSGVSGSGKSSLVHDVIYGQAQHDFLETLNSYARRSLPKTSSVECRSISGLAPCVVIDQHTFPNSPRSTVGTYTDIYTGLRLLFSRTGTPAYYSGAFSFNNPDGCCERCLGLGESMEVDIHALLDLDKSLNEGAIRHKTWKTGGRYWNIIRAIGRFDMDKPLRYFSDEEMELLLYSPPFVYEDGAGSHVQTFSYEGIVGRMRKRMNDERGLSSATYDQQFFQKECCPICFGIRLNEKARAVSLPNGMHMADLVNLEITELADVLRGLRGTVEEVIIPPLLKELQNLIDVGVGYLTLNRSVSTLSGGEAHKVKLARQLGNSLSDMIYILDEPTTGLHPKDIGRIIRICHDIVRKHNTLLVIDHNLQMLREADHIIDMGPGAGRNGGKIVDQGPAKVVLAGDRSVTADAIRKLRPHVKPHFRKPYGMLHMKQITCQNLRDFSVDIPLGIFTSITGVSGAGKSTLMRKLKEMCPHAELIDQGSIGRNSRGNIGTYSKLFDKIRKFYAEHTGISVSEFSFNSSGACERCNGLGHIITDVHYMGEIRTRCEECGGNRYRPRILEQKVCEKNITDILNMTVEEALNWFAAQPDIRADLEELYGVGLGYVTIGQPLDTLSGGELQRLKLSSRLKKKREIYLIDEPTKGLHIRDITELIKVLNQIVDQGNTVIVVEHNLDIICQSDWIIDLGPEGGHKGGRLMFSGTPRDLYQNSGISHTGHYMKAYIDQFAESDRTSQ